jgi:hypothetical protein
MWTYPAWNLWTADEPPRPRRSTVEWVLARARHPSFTPDVADDLVRDLSRRALRQLWKETGRLLEGNLEDDVRFNVVVLRERLLERVDPVADRTSGRDGGRRRGERRRGDRS